MKILSGNLAEGAPPAGSVQAQAQAPKKEAQPAEQTPRQQSGQEQVKVEATVEAAPPGQAPTAAGNGVKMEFAFEIESIAASLYDGSSNLVSTYC